MRPLRRASLSWGALLVLEPRALPRLSYAVWSSSDSSNCAKARHMPYLTKRVGVGCWKALDVGYDAGTGMAGLGGVTTARVVVPLRASEGVVRASSELVDAGLWLFLDE